MWGALLVLFITGFSGICASFFSSSIGTCISFFLVGLVVIGYPIILIVCLIFMPPVDGMYYFGLSYIFTMVELILLIRYIHKKPIKSVDDEILVKQKRKKIICTIIIFICVASIRALYIIIKMQALGLIE